jgi:hypothetical protein
MTAELPVKRPLTQLNFEIEQLEAESSKLDREREAIAKGARRLSLRLRYLQFVRWIRKPAEVIEMWPVALIVIGGGLVGFLMVVVVSTVSGSLPLAVLSFLFGLAAGAAAFASVLYRPPDVRLPATIAEAESQARLASARLKEKAERIAETKTRLQKLVDERRDQIASGKLQRAALLQRHWKAMRDVEWEDFVVEVLRTHGATVERSGRLDEHDANLIVDLGTRRVAVLTFADGQVANSATIQKAISAKERLRCDACAVIINRRFTGAAQDFAQRNGCTAVGAGEFPDFVLGKIAL